MARASFDPSGDNASAVTSWPAGVFGTGIRTSCPGTAADGFTRSRYQVRGRAIAASLAMYPSPLVLGTAGLSAGSGCGNGWVSRTNVRSSAAPATPANVVPAGGGAARGTGPRQAFPAVTLFGAAPSG